MRLSVEDFLIKKSRLCDQRKWDEYIDLFDEDCIFHIPQWCNDTEITTDPDRQMSLIYYTRRAGLEDRVFRIRTGKAASTIPLPRTVHFVSNVSVGPHQDGIVRADVNWVTHFYRDGEASHFFGTADYLLRPEGQSWRIRRKHIVIMNDRISQVMDFYHV